MDDTGVILRFKVPAEIWTVNRGQNWRKNMRLHAAWAKAAAHAYTSAGNPALPVPCQVEAQLTFGVQRRRDPHNYVGTVVKAIVDGLVHAGAFPDDNPTYVTVVEPVLAVGPEQTVWVTLSQGLDHGVQIIH